MVVLTVWKFPQAKRQTDLSLSASTIFGVTCFSLSPCPSCPYIPVAKDVQCQHSKYAVDCSLGNQNAFIPRNFPKLELSKSYKRNLLSENGQSQLYISKLAIKLLLQYKFNLIATLIKKHCQIGFSKGYKPHLLFVTENNRNSSYAQSKIALETSHF